MSWRIDDHPEGGLQVTHLDAPRFTARWTTGEFPIDQVRDGAFFWTDEGGGEEDAIHLYGFEWHDAPQQGSALAALMVQAALAIEGYVLGGGGGHDDVRPPNLLRGGRT